MTIRNSPIISPLPCRRNAIYSYDTIRDDTLASAQNQFSSGITGINQQDRAVQESMGFIVDRGREHLGPADRAIIVMRQLLLQAERTVREGGDPPGTDDSYYHIRAWEKILPRDQDWRAALLPEMYPAGQEREPAPVG